MEETQGNYGGITSINVIIIYHKKIKHLKEICAWAGFQSAKRTMVRARTSYRRRLMVDYFCPVELDRGSEGERL